MMPTHFLYQETIGQTLPGGSAVCCLCGFSCGDCVPVAGVIRDTFTNHGLCRAPHSRDVCLACDHYYNHRWEVGQKYQTEYRKHSMRVLPGQGFHAWQRAEMRADLAGWLRDGFPGGVLVVALSKKKHCLPLAVVNPAGRLLVVQLEEEPVAVESDAWFALAEAFDGLLNLGARKGEILSGHYYHQTLRKAGANIGRLFTLDRIIRPWRPSGLLTLVSYVTLLEEDDGDGTGGTAGD